MILTIDRLHNLQASHRACMTVEDVRAQTRIEVPDSGGSIRAARDEDVANVLKSPDPAIVSSEAHAEPSGPGVVYVNGVIIRGRDELVVIKLYGCDDAAVLRSHCDAVRRSLPVPMLAHRQAALVDQLQRVNIAVRLIARCCRGLCGLALIDLVLIADVRQRDRLPQAICLI